jgi:hypothetical protein
MPRGFGRLPFLARHGASAAQSRLGASANADPGIDDDAPVGPPVLLPAMIHRMILIDATELTPVWARPRSPQPAATAPLAATAAAVARAEPDPAASTAEPVAPMATRKRKANAAAGEAAVPSTPRSPGKSGGRGRRPDAQATIGAEAFRSS